jgi:hypothetical protein
MPTPISGQVTTPAVVGAEVVLLIGVPARFPEVPVVGVVFTVPLVGAKMTAVAEPVAPQP